MVPFTSWFAPQTGGRVTLSFRLALFWDQDVFIAPILREPDVWGPWMFEGDTINFG